MPHPSKWSQEKRFEIVVRVLRGESVVQVCRENEVSATQFYKWREAFLRGAQEGLKDKRNPQNRDPVLEENRKLKKLLAEQLLINEGPKKLYQLGGEGS
jgi:transposase